MGEQIAGYDLEQRGPHRYVYSELRRCVAWTRPADAGTEIRVLAWHDVPQQVREPGRPRAERGYYVVPHSQVTSWLRQILPTVRRRDDRAAPRRPRRGAQHPTRR